MRVVLRLLAFTFLQVRGAVIEVTAGGAVSDPTYQFSGWNGEHLANLSANHNSIVASDDLKTGSGNSVDDLATRLAAAESTIATLLSTMYTKEEVRSLLNWDPCGAIVTSPAKNSGCVTAVANVAGYQGGTAQFFDGFLDYLNIDNFINIYDGTWAQVGTPLTGFNGDYHSGPRNPYNGCSDFTTTKAVQVVVGCCNGCWGAPQGFPINYPNHGTYTWTMLTASSGNAGRGLVLGAGNHMFFTTVVPAGTHNCEQSFKCILPDGSDSRVLGTVGPYVSLAYR